MTQYRLLARAELHGAVRDPGFVFELAPGEVGPHRTVVASNHGAQITDHLSQEQRLEDVALYEEVKDDSKPEAVEEVVLSDEHAKDKAVIADLERELADKNEQLGAAHAKLASIDAALSGKPLLLDEPVSTAGKPLYEPAKNIG